MIDRIVLMGVAGCGKSSVGAALSALTGIPYRDGDDLHPPGNVEKMSQGVPLTDEDRWPWLDRVAGVLRDNAPMIVGCSALRRAYRERIRSAVSARTVFVHLKGSRELIEQRMAARSGHFMPVSLLDSQFRTLEPPEGEPDTLTVNIDKSTSDLASEISARLKEMSA